MKYWFTSDPHYGHKNIIELCDRNFVSVEDMNLLLVNNCSKIDKSDILYILGDVSFYKAARSIELLSDIKCRKRLILGNHDSVIRKNNFSKIFESIREYEELKITIDGDNVHFVLSHFPMITWHKSGGGSVMLHGHCHGRLKYPFVGRIMDVGVDVHGFKPISANYIWSKMKNVTPHKLG